VPGTPGISLTKAGDGYIYLKDQLLGTTVAYSDTTGKFYSETIHPGLIRKVIYDGWKRVYSIAQWPADIVSPERRLPFTLNTTIAIVSSALMIH
jgi:hypothetical protein